MRAYSLAIALIAATAAASPQAPKSTTAGKQSSPAKSPSASANAQFDKIVAQADEARKAEHWEDAIALYEKAVKLRPKYVQGYWYQGTAYYTLDKFDECRGK